ncbi:gliding motility-associated C-terminal domain-containing protein [Hymenobacter sp. 15J16-1T3B]|uniref:T9SS type B sorting domain-containing protein n=1 Tax=Hymenobacter sp. 15J16-1T3B TaxID=2886941 RepID=UPI001D109477|nr:gliding motility-associated C-terminal domain-containing protein [Hymenobacter sp. 15J16-1T3B]MCC3160528.1 gliding motility-associated C-terminal domain-containing protein [Hymenobacter sp. 15J16-1T3B]
MKHFNAPVVLCCLLCLLLSRGARAQREFDNWYFGLRAGVAFGPSGPRLLTDGAMSSGEGCAAISDAQGNLLLYTNGITVWNRQHQIMVGGTEIGGYNGTNSELTPNSATQGVTVVPRPGSRTEYFIFTVDAAENSFRHGFRYSVVDLSRQGGLGEVVRKDVQIPVPVGDGRLTEKLVAVRHANQQDIWLVVHGWNNNVFLSYLLTANGLAPAPVWSSGGVVHQGGRNGRSDYNALGYMKVAPTGRRLALGQYNGALELFDFNYGTGVVSGPRRLPDPPVSLPAYYGLEFSPDGNLLYVGLVNNIYQYALPGGNPVLVGGVSNANGALQLGPDQKIYQTRLNVATATLGLNVIAAPNVAGLGCGVRENAVTGFDAAHFPSMGLPNVLVRPPVPGEVLVNFALLSSDVCFGDDAVFSASIYPLIPDATITWNFGEPGAGAGNVATGARVTHRYAQPGTYTVTMTVREVSGAVHTYSQAVNVFHYTVARLAPTAPAQCIGTTAVLSVVPAVPDGTRFLWSDGSTAPTLRVRSSGHYWVEVTAPQRCPVRDSVTLTFYPAPVVSLGADPEICANERVLLRPSPQPAGNTYRWQDGSTGASFDATQAGRYTVLVTNPNGCSTEAAVQVRFGESCPFMIPNIITPNGDGQNDAFAPQGLEPNAWRLQVFNRWGVKVYEQPAYQNDWAAPGQSAGTYFYLLEHATSGRRLKGWLEVVR